MHDALRNAFVVEVGDLLAQDEVFQQGRPAQAGFQRILVVTDGDALIGRQHLARGVGARRVERGGSAAGLGRKIGFAEGAGGCQCRLRSAPRLSGCRRDGVVTPELLALVGVVRHRPGQCLDGGGLLRQRVGVTRVSFRSGLLLGGHRIGNRLFHGVILCD
jgi:hypothetical protein